MGEIIEFKRRAPQEDKSIKPEIRKKEVLDTVTRIIGAIEDNNLDNENVVLDMEALKDIFSAFSVRESDMVNILSQAEEENVIKRNDKIILFVLYLVFNENDLGKVIGGLIEGQIDQDDLEGYSNEIKSYFCRIIQKSLSTK